LRNANRSAYARFGDYPARLLSCPCHPRALFEHVRRNYLFSALIVKVRATLKCDMKATEQGSIHKQCSITFSAADAVSRLVCKAGH
jgi:hypothetical protein